MSKYTKLVFVFLLFFICQKTFAQDIILFKNGESVKVKILVAENENNEIEYVYFNDTLGPVFKVPLKTISLIKSKGTLQVLETQTEIIYDSLLSPLLPMNKIDINQFSCHQLDSMGRTHAQINFNSRNVGSSIFLTTLLTGPISGAIASLVSNSKTPNTYHLNMPVTPLLESEIYQNAYKKQVHKARQEKIEKNYWNANIILSSIFIIYNILGNPKR
jgi:hypothetical protein